MMTVSYVWKSVFKASAEDIIVLINCSVAFAYNYVVSL